VKLKGPYAQLPPHENAQRSSGVIVRILILRSRSRLVVIITPLPLYPQGKPRFYPLDRRLGGSENQLGCYGEERNLLLLTRIEPRYFDRATISNDLSEYAMDETGSESCPVWLLAVLIV
jgi:hypothetical protein